MQIALLWGRRQKRLWMLWALLLLAAVLLLGAPKALADRETQAQVLGNEVNMRSQPNKNAESIAQLPIGAMVTVLETTDQSGESWCHVSYNNQEGYIRSDMLFVRALKGRLAFVNEDGGNLRGGPATSAYVLAQLEVGKPVTVEQLVGDWYYVTYEGQEGFVFRDLLLLTNREASADASELFRFGMEGSEIKRFQEELAKRNFMDKKHATGYFGAITRQAVEEFQKAADLDVDGVVSSNTMGALMDPDNKVRKVPKVPQRSDDFRGRVIEAIWRNSNKGSNILKRPGGTATLYDVRSGKSFKIRRTGGTNHIDATPLNAEETKKMKDIYGGRWTHDRRPVIMIIGSRFYAASLYGMPHGGDVQKGDNYPGMLCVHLTGSRTHGGGSLDSGHQGNIRSIMRKYGKQD